MEKNMQMQKDFMDYLTVKSFFHAIFCRSSVLEQDGGMTIE